MKALELINLYQRGRRNFSREDLIGENFDGQQLSNINLSHTNLRGTSFVNANLTGANFTYAKAGSILEVSFSRIIFQLTVACLAMSLSTYYCISFFSTLGEFLDGSSEEGAGFVFLQFFILGIPSLIFRIFSSTWITENRRIILTLYFVTIFILNIIIYYSTHKTTLIWGFICLSIMLSPLIILVSTTTHYIVESLPYGRAWTMKTTSFKGAILQKADFSRSTLGNTDFRLSQLEGTCFYQAKHLNAKLFKNR